MIFLLLCPEKIFIPNEFPINIPAWKATKNTEEKKEKLEKRVKVLYNHVLIMDCFICQYMYAIQLKFKPQYIPCSVLMTKNANLFWQIMQLIVLCIYGFFYYLFCVLFEYGGFVFVFTFKERKNLPIQVNFMQMSGVLAVKVFSKLH